ncbi:hypothetical protein [Novosphingobium mathurense]|uniref:Uncharacterized protein n=1 Tax=Novosphingobium mathurense TaxID=428990 RepID=A0A1U6ILV4_9SPHN|nr:hypothetical protein [Novosphingobium mathurense]SLK08964.1 hypothetical protein SAMN06295987_10951 [Novosphingobium mathurense]
MMHDQYIRRETLVSMTINGVLSLLFFLLVFGIAPSVAVWGIGNWVFDYLPQSFMITLMSTLVPGALTAKRLKAGVLTPSGSASRLPRPLLLRALLMAVVAALLGTTLVAALAGAVGIVTLGWTSALVIKVLYGVALGAVVTPIGLRAALTNA